MKVTRELPVYLMLQELEEELEKVKIWNKKTFYDATLSGQLEKLEEELGEMSKAKTFEEQGKELADVFIVLGGLRRWNSKVGTYYENTMTKNMPFAVVYQLLKDVRKKMEINRKRSWQKSGDGTYHHKKGIFSKK